MKQFGLNRTIPFLPGRLLKSMDTEDLSVADGVLSIGALTPGEAEFPGLLTDVTSEK